MKDKIIVITGATRGLGLRLKEDLSKDNVVVTLSRSEVENGKTAFRADVSDFDDVKRVFDEIGKIYGRIDVLINNAGYGLSGATEIMKKEEIERITNVNFLGAIWCTKCALPYMTKGAKIAVISSASGLTPMPFRTMYNSTKAALTMFSYSRGLERVAIFRSPSILPHDGIINRFSCLGVPHDSGLALVGDSDGGDVRSPKSKRCDRLSHHRIFGGPDLHRIVLHHPRLREMLCEFLLANSHSLAPLIENNGS